MGFSFGSPYGSPYYLGGGSATLVPFVADVALGGRAYLIDWSADNPLDLGGIDTLRPQSDQSDDPGEQSVNPEASWRRSTESWHFGSGQRHFDRKTSIRDRFYQSRGIYVWEPFQISLLPEVLPQTISSNTNQKLAVAGTHQYDIDGTNLKFLTALGGSLTNVTGVPAAAPTSIVSDGFNVWTSHTASGIYKTTRGAATTVSHITGTVTGLGFARGRVLASNANSIYDVTTLATGAGGALPAALFTQPNTDFTWVGFAEGSSYIYAAGFSGDKSLIYRIHIKEDGTGLDAPIVAGELPDGEIIRTIYGYLGKFLAIGTDLGWRLAIQTDGGDLRIGAKVITPMPVLCFEGQGEFIWYGLGNFDSTHTGLGRLSTSTFSDLDNLVPAYASDLMLPNVSGNITSISFFAGKHVFMVNAIGMYYEGVNLTTSGYLDSGQINFNLTEDKIGLFIDAQHSGTLGTHEISISVDGESFTSLGIHEPGTTFNVGQIPGMNFEIRNTLYRDTSPTLGLTIHSWLFRVEPRPILTDFIYVTIYLAEQTESLVDTNLYFDTFAELDYITDLYRAKDITTFQYGNRSESVIVENYRMMVKQIEHGQEGINGLNLSCLLKLKKVF